MVSYVTLEEFGGSLSDTVGTTNRAAYTSAMLTGKDILYNGIYTVDGPVQFTGGTRHFTHRHRGGAGLNFKLTNSPSAALFSTYDYSGDSYLDGITLTVDPSSTFQTGAVIEILKHNGGRFISVDHCKINGLAESSNAVFIGARFKANGVSDSSFNNDIIYNWFNNCDTDILIDGESDSMLNCIGFNINGNQLLSASNLVDHANIIANYGIQLTVTGNKFNAQGESSGVGAKSIILNNTSHVHIAGNYYDQGTNGKLRVKLSGATSKVQIIETMISPVEVANSTGNIRAYTFNGVTRGSFTPFIQGSDVAGSNTYSIQQGWFDLIGDKTAHYWGYVAISQKITPMSGKVQIGGFPFQPVAGKTQPTGSINHWDYVNLSTDATSMLGMIFPNDTKFRIMECFDGSTKYADYLPVEALGNQAGFRFDIFCEIS